MDIVDFLKMKEFIEYVRELVKYKNENDAGEVTAVASFRVNEERPLLLEVKVIISDEVDNGSN